MTRPLLSLISILTITACDTADKGDTGAVHGAGDDTSADDTSADDTAAPVDDDGDGYVADEDCDDTDAAVNPGATEVCDDVDNDCDGLVDDADDSVDLSTGAEFYADGDGDGYGQGDAAVMACAPPSGTVTDATDCDDADAAVNPGATEVWYDGADSDCDGANDYDADADGDDALDFGGTDCDDHDPARYGGEGCRPQVSCTHPDAATLNSYGPAGGADIQFDDTCDALISIVSFGRHSINVVDDTGAETLIGSAPYDINAVTVDPNTGALVAGFGSTQAVGYQSGTDLTIIAHSGVGRVTGGDGPYANFYMNDSPVSIAMDTSGCIWTTNWTAKGVLACVQLDGTATTWTLGGDTLQTLDLDSAEDLYVVVDDTIYLFDSAGSGSLTSWYVAPDTILDFVFDYNDDVYIETLDNVITKVSADLSTETTFAGVTGEAKLAISPDGFLVRIIGAPVGVPTWEEFSLE